MDQHFSGLVEQTLKSEIMNWIKSYLRYFHMTGFWAEESSSTILPAGRLKKVVEIIDKTRDNELTCEEVHIFLGQAAEQTGLKTVDDLPLVAQHLSVCLECREEYEALVRILQAARGEKPQHE
jgi:hypothetical protein